MYFFRDFGCAADPGNPATSGPALPYGESVEGKIALILRGACRFDEKVAVAESQGAVGVIVFNDFREGLVTMSGDPIVNIPAVFMKESRGNLLAALREADTPVQATLTPGPFDGYGFVRFMDTKDPGDIQDLGTLKLESTTDMAGPPTTSTEVVTRGSSAYIAWLGEGLIVADFSDPSAPRVIARTTNENLQEVELHGSLILAVERTTGLDEGVLRIYKHVPDKPGRGKVAQNGVTPQTPVRFTLEPAYPNPSTGGAMVDFALPEAAEVRLVVYDVMGREVARLADGTLPAGRHTARFDGARLPSGIYLVRMTTGAGFAQTQRLTLVR